MKKLILYVALLLTVPAVKAQTIELDLSRCREMAVEHSRKLETARQLQLKSGFEKKGIRAKFLPKISANGLYAYVKEKMDYRIEGGYLPVMDGRYDAGNLPLGNLVIGPEGLPVIGPDGMPVFKQYAFLPDIELELGIRNATNVGILLEQPLYMGGKIRSAFRMASIGEEIAALNFRYNKAEVIAETDEAYWTYLKVTEQVKAAEKYLEVTGELVKNIEDASQTGLASRNDLLKARVRQNEAELMVQKARNGQELSRMNLCRLIGKDLDSRIAVTENLETAASAGLPTGKTDVSGRPEYNLLEKEVELKNKEVALTRSEFLPQLGISAGYSYGDGIRLNGDSEPLSTFTAVASLKIPIYGWGEGRNKIKSKKTEEEISRLKKEETAELMRLEAAKARFQVENSLERVRLTRKSLDQAEENMKDSRNRYELGLETLTVHMEAQAQWQKAWSDWIEAKAGLQLSRTLYLKATGQLE